MINFMFYYSTQIYQVLMWAGSLGCSGYCFLDKYQRLKSPGDLPVSFLKAKYIADLELNPES